MMNRVILHAGMHKTGSSSLQKELGNLDDTEAKYASLQYSNHSIAFYAAFSKNYLNDNSWEFLGFSQEEVKNKRAEFRNLIKANLIENRNRDLIFSAEDLVRLDKDETLEMLNFIKKYTQNPISVYAYVRDPIEFTQSATGQVIRESKHPEFPHGVNYRKYFGDFVSLLKKDDLHFKLYDKKLLMNQDIIDDFYAWVGIKKQRDISDNHVQENSSCSTTATKILYLLNKTNPLCYGGKDITKARNKMIRILSELFPGSLEIPIELLEPVINKEDVAWMEEVGSFKFNSVKTNRNGKYDSLSTYLSSIPEDAIDTLLEYLRSCGVAYTYNRDPIKLSNRLFYFCLQSNDQNSREAFYNSLTGKMLFKLLFKKVVKKCSKGYL